jgi:hypothetical protein
MRVLLPALVLATACETVPVREPGPASTTSATSATSVAHAPDVAWRRWDKATFDDAKAGRKIIVVTIATEWCHWCHVMDEKTWGDPEVQALVASRFVAIREDADARPDLAERYADWGWPALAILTPEGAPVTELRGYQDKATFLPLLRSLVDKLDRGEKLERPAVAASTQKSPLDAIHAFAFEQLTRSYDDKARGWGAPQKYPFWAPAEHALLRGALRGDDASRARGLETLDAERSLIDPVDGGMFQYSLDGVWTAPHYEKLAEVNGAAMGSFALAYLATRDEKYADAGRAIHRYLTTTLRDPSGAFYANQDADLGTRGDATKMLGKQYYALGVEARRKAGSPFVDKNIYASHNGRIIAGMARLASALGDDKMLADAVAAANVVVATHAGDRGFTHAPRAATSAEAELHLADQLAMGNAFAELGEATGDRAWRERALAVARGVLRDFLDDKDGGFYAHTVTASTPAIDRRKPLRANAEAARLLLKVGRLEGDASLVEAAKKALSSFASEAQVKEEGRLIGEYVLALEEEAAEPLHFAVVGAKDDAGARALLRAALAVNAPYRIVEITAPGEKYPDLGKPALFICGESFCSPPITDPAVVAKKAAPFLKPRG